MADSTQGKRSVRRRVRPLHRDHTWMLRRLAKNLKDTRIGLGISMGAMAKLSGVNKGHCSRIERGANISVVNLYKLCWSLGVHPRDVLPEYRPNPKLSDRT